MPAAADDDLPQRRRWLTGMAAIAFTGGWLAIAMRVASSVPRASLRSLHTKLRHAELGKLTLLARVILTRNDRDELIALDRRCPHLGCKVGAGQGNDNLRCPCHGSEFSLPDGERLSGPATRGLHQLEVTIDGADQVVIHGLD